MIMIYCGWNFQKVLIMNITIQQRQGHLERPGSRSLFRQVLLLSVTGDASTAAEQQRHGP